MTDTAQLPHDAGVLLNLRDVGGLPVEGGGRVRTGLLLRSAAPHRGDRASGVAWPAADVVDLRSSEEHEAPHPLAGPRTRVHTIPLLSAPLPGRDGDWSAMPDLATAYRGFMASGADQIVQVLGIAARTEGPLLVHCAAGKDRTGIVVAVLLRVAGTTRDAITDDYVRTAQHIDAVLARDLTARQPADPTLAQKLLGSPPEAIATVLDQLDNTPGGAAGWLQRHGAASADIDMWRGRIVDS